MFHPIRYKCEQCGKFYRERPDFPENNTCDCARSDSLGNYLGVMSQMYVRKAISLREVGECEGIDSLIEKIQQEAKVELNKAKILLTINFSDLKTLLSLFLLSSPKILVQIHPNLVLNTLVEYITYCQWDQLKIFNADLQKTLHPGQEILVQQLFSRRNCIKFLGALGIDPENELQQIELLKRLHESGCLFWLKQAKPFVIQLVTEFFPKIKFDFEGEALRFYFALSPIQTNLEEQLASLALINRFQDLDRRLYVLTVPHDLSDKHFSALYQKLFLSTEAPNRAYHFLVQLLKLEKKSAPLARKTQFHLLMTLLFRVQENWQDPLAKTRFEMFFRENCLDLAFTEVVIRNFIREVSLLNIASRASIFPIDFQSLVLKMRQMIFALECFLGQFVSMQPFLSGPFFQGLKKSYVIAANTTNSVQHPIASPSRREALTQQLLSLRNRLNLQSAFATFKTGLGILTRQQEIQRFEAGIHKVFQLQEGQAQEAVTVLSKTFSFLAPLVLLAAEKKIDLFIHGTALSYCVYKLAGLPSDINVLIYPTSEENLRQVQAVLSSESLACLKVGMSGSQSVCERYISHGNSTGKIVDVKVVIDRNSYRNEISCDLLSVYLKIEPSLREGVFLTLATRDGQQFICEPKQIQYFLEDARSADYSQIHLALRASRASFSELNQQRLESQRHLWAQAHQRVYQPDYSRYG